MGEMLDLYVLTWMSSTSSLPAAERESALRRGQERHEHFRKELLRRLAGPRSPEENKNQDTG